MSGGILVERQDCKAARQTVDFATPLRRLGLREIFDGIFVEA
jgi:hypothetical protein